MSFRWNLLCLCSQQYNHLLNSPFFPISYPHLSRKQRFLFRMCLISLAISDLIFVVVTTCIYVSKFITRNTLLWVSEIDSWIVWKYDYLTVKFTVSRSNRLFIVCLLTNNACAYQQHHAGVYSFWSLYGNCESPERILGAFEAFLSRMLHNHLGI